MCGARVTAAIVPEGRSNLRRGVRSEPRDDAVEVEDVSLVRAGPQVILLRFSEVNGGRSRSARIPPVKGKVRRTEGDCKFG